MADDGDEFVAYRSDAPMMLSDARIDGAANATIATDSNGDGSRVINFSNSVGKKVHPLQEKGSFDAYISNEYGDAVEVTVANAPTSTEVDVHVLRITPNTL